MRQLINTSSSSELEYPLSLPKSLTLTGYDYTLNAEFGSGSSHPQGIALDIPNNRFFISYTDNINCFDWTTKEFLYKTTYKSGDTHYGDIAYFDDKVYCGVTLKEPYKKYVVFDANDLSVIHAESYRNRGTVETYYGAMSADSNGRILVSTYQNEVLGVKQQVTAEMSLYTYDVSTQEIIVNNGDGDFSDAWQSMAFKPNENRGYLAWIYYNIGRLFCVNREDESYYMIPFVIPDLTTKQSIFGIDFIDKDNLVLMFQDSNDPNKNCILAYYKIRY